MIIKTLHPLFAVIDENHVLLGITDDMKSAKALRSRYLEKGLIQCGGIIEFNNLVLDYNYFKNDPILDYKALNKRKLI